MMTEGEAPPPNRLWTLNKVDIRAPVSPRAWPVARVELDHGERGRMSDVATAPGELEAAFAAVSHIIGVSGRIHALEMRYVPGEEGACPAVVVDISIAVGEDVFAGQARGRDILPCCVAAYIDAAAAAGDANLANGGKKEVKVA